MSLSEIIRMLGCFMCAAYAITFVMLGCGLTVEIWRDRHRELKAPIPAIRSAVSVLVFFAAAAPFGYWCFQLLPI